MKINQLLLIGCFYILFSVCNAQTHINFFDIGYEVSPDSLKKLGLENIIIDIRIHDTLLSLSGGNKDTSVIFDVIDQKWNPNYGKIVSQTVIVKNMNDKLELFFGNNFQVLTKPDNACGYFLVRYKRNNHLYVCFLSEHVLSLTTLFPTAFLLDDYTIPELIK